MLKRFGLAVTVFGSAAILGASAALAVLLASSGGSTIQVQDRSDTAPSITASTAFVDLPGANVVVTVPAGTSRLLTARFTAESLCTGAAGKWCSVRVVVSAASGATVEMNPAAGIDFAFDGVSSDLWESNAIERSLRVPSGTYRVRLQRATSAPGVTFRLDDWHFRVDTNV